MMDDDDRNDDAIIQYLLLVIALAVFEEIHPVYIFTVTCKFR